MFNKKKKITDNSKRILEQELLETKAELERYKNAYGMIEKIAPELRNGNLEARIVGWQDHEELSEPLKAINYILDITDAYVREAGASLEAAKNGEYYRKFLSRGMPGSFDIGAKVINQACENIQKLEQEAQNSRKQMADEFNNQIMQFVTELLDATGHLNNIFWKSGRLC